MGAISGDELIRWEKAEGVEVAEGVDAAVVDGGKLEKILVSVRLRPLNAKEIAANDPADWECINDSTIIFRNSLMERSGFPTAYTFDRVFRGDCTTRQVYEEAAKEVALSVVGGINSTIFAYGQTSSGKTYTMSGITEYTAADIYDYIQRHEERVFVLKFSAIEIYNEAVKDLLSTDSTPLRVLDDPEKGTIVEKLTEEILRDWNHLKQLLSVCEAQRQIGETLLNEMSSRSHQILRLTIESSAREFLGKDNSSTLAASVNFVDLAGSERASQALSVGTRLKEGCHINRSLLSLGTVIRKLSKGRSAHIPYRDSKLTRILQPSLGGNARTAIICTMSPARSHIEQSRNTLLFASCAKEVATNARVNVVMSDKALVKHLQKELARLESELRYPGTNPSTSHFEALLREKDFQIKKMHKEIKELIQQRDLAQSRLQDLLQVVEGDTVSRVSRQWEESTPISTYHVPRTYEDVLLTSESFGEAYNGLDFEFTESASNGRDDSESYLQLIEKPKEQSTASSRNSINGPIFVRAIPHQAEEVNQGNYEYSEELCKEVQCIEMNGSVLSTEGSKTLLPLTSDSMGHGDHEPTTYTQMDLRTIATNSSNITLEQHLENVRKKLHGITKANAGESFPRSSGCDLSSFRGMALSRSRSCRETLMKNSSPWFHEGEENDSTPPSISFKNYPGRPERFLRRRAALNYDAEIESPSRDELHTPARSISSSVLDTPSTTTAYRGGITSINDFVAGLKEMAHVQYQKQLTGDQETEQNASEDFGAEGVTNDVGLNPASNPLESPSRWPLEFEKKQQEILDLWHACNVSLVHRTYFFLLFKGDPTDSIYMEVELRRLSFLKRMYSQGNPLVSSAEGGQKVTLASSIRRLRREREMLWRYMHKRLSAEERESIYTKWGIPLDSKQRKLQLVQRLWTETTDLEHVRESASIVARLIGLQEEGQALKEMFGLSFTPQLSKQRSLRWKHGNSLRK